MVKCSQCCNSNKTKIEGFISCHTVPVWNYLSDKYPRTCVEYKLKPKVVVDPFSRKIPSIFSMKEKL